MRKHYLDNIRWITVLLVVLYHVIYMYNGITAGGAGTVTDFRGQDIIQYILYPWFMVILFIISGMCSRYYLENHTDKEYIKGRTLKLLVPSTIGLLVLGWAQGYFNMAMADAFKNIPDNVPGFVMYIIMVVSGIGVLWTIQVMWVCSLILVLIRKIEKGRLLNLGEKVNVWCIILLGVVVWGSAQILNTPMISVYRFGIYIFTFLLGYYVFSHEKVTDILAKYSVYFIAAAVVLGGLYTYFYYGKNYAERPYVNNPLAIAYAWFACLAIFGVMKRWGNRTGKVAAFINRRSFGLYIFHYLALSVAAYLMVICGNMRGIIVYLISVVAAYGGGFLLNEIVSRIPVIRWCVLGIRKEKKGV